MISSVMYDMISNDVNKTEGMLKGLEIFVGDKITLRSKIQIKRTYKWRIGFITEIIWPHLCRAHINLRYRLAVSSC